MRLRGQPAALAIVDRCLALIARAEGADAREMARLDAEVEDLRAELEARFGPRPAVVVH